MPIIFVQLALKQLKALVQDPSHVDQLRVLENALPSPVISAAVAALEAGNAQLWHSPFAFVDLDAREVAGSASFKGEPVSGRVEIGYGVADERHGKGMATAAVLHLAMIALAHSEVREVYAETAVANRASRRVVEKAGFRCIGQRVSEEDGLVDRWLLSS